MQDTQEQQAAIEIELINGMIESTPESWTEIVLTLSRPPGTGPSMTGDAGTPASMALELVSPQGHPPASPEDSLIEAACRLDALWRSLPRALVKAVYVATYDGSQWRYRIKYHYEDAPR